MRPFAFVRAVAPLATLLALATASTGCVKRILIDGQVDATRIGSAVFDSLGDYEQARSAAQANLAMFEGFHRLVPQNEDALFLLTKSWSGYAFAFIEDDLEVAEDAGNAPLATYHRRRAVQAYERAIFYGVELLGHEDDGFDKAKGDAGTLAAWLDKHFDDIDQAETLFWLGNAWLGRIEVSRGDALGAKTAGERFVGTALLDRALKLDRKVGDGKGLMALAAAHARQKPMDSAAVKKLFDEARATTVIKGSDLLVSFTEASTYACAAGNNALYTQLLKSVTDTEEPDFAHQLENEVARHRARRWLKHPRSKERCGF